MAGFSPIAGPGLPGDVLKKKKEEEEKKASAKTSASAGPQPQPQKSQAYYDGGARRRQTSGTEPEAKKTEKKKTAETGVFSPIAGTISPLDRMRKRTETGSGNTEKDFIQKVQREYERTTP